MYKQSPAEDKPRKRIHVTKILAISTVFIVVFGVGVGVGNGSIVVGRDGAYKKSVSKDLPANLDYTSVEQVYDVLRRDFAGELDASKLLEGLKQGMANATGDQYTEYLNAEKAKEFDEDLNGTKSVKSSPGAVLDAPEHRQKMSMREMLEDEVKRLPKRA